LCYPKGMRYSERELRRYLNEYLQGSTAPAALEAFQQAQDVGLDIHEFAFSPKRRLRHHRRRQKRVPKAVHAQAARIAYYCILIPEAERMLMPEGFYTTPEPMSRRDLAHALWLTYPGRWYDLLAPKLTREDAERILDEPPQVRGGFAPTFRVPRSWGPSTVSGRGGCPPLQLDPWLPEEFYKKHVQTDAVGAPVPWEATWSRRGLLPTPAPTNEVEQPNEIEQPNQDGSEPQPSNATEGTLSPTESQDPEKPLSDAERILRIFS